MDSEKLLTTSNHGHVGFIIHIMILSLVNTDIPGFNDD